MSVDFITWSPLPWLGLLFVLIIGLCRAAAAGDRQLEQARESLAKPTLVPIESDSTETRGSITVTTSVGPVSIGPWRSDVIRNWALEDGDRPPGADERAARAATRPRPTGLAEVIPLRRREDGAA